MLGVKVNAKPEEETYFGVGWEWLLEPGGHIVYYPNQDSVNVEEGTAN